MATDKHDPKERVSTDTTIAATDNKISRRGLLTKAAMGVPLALTLAHKPAFGAICSISGFQSVNPSGVNAGQTVGPGCGGYSPGGWKENGTKTGNQDGNRNQWLAAGFNPNPRQNSDDAPGTLFYASNAFANTISSGIKIEQHDTLHDVLINHSGSLECHAIANLLNASYFIDYRLSPRDVVGLYDAYTRNLPTYTTENSTIVKMANIYNQPGGLKAFFDQYNINQYQ